MIHLEKPRYDKLSFQTNIFLLYSNTKSQNRNQYAFYWFFWEVNNAVHREQLDLARKFFYKVEYLWPAGVNALRSISYPIKYIPLAGTSIKNQKTFMNDQNLISLNQNNINVKIVLYFTGLITLH